MGINAIIIQFSLIIDILRGYQISNFFELDDRGRNSNYQKSVWIVFKSKNIPKNTINDSKIIDKV